MIVWCDTETSSLDERTGHLFEIAVVVTDDELNEHGSISMLCRPIGIDIDSIRMDDVVREMHTKNGLLDELRACSTRRYEAQSMLQSFFDGLAVAHQSLKTVPLGGSTIAFDRRWLREHMPTIEGLFSHRSVDVSSMTELAKRWAPEVYKSRPGLGPGGKPLPGHRALPDIRMSIETLRHYRRSGFIGAGA